MAEGTQPLKYSQSLNTHFTIMQPKNLVGSSFASPLFAGVLALMKNPKKELSSFLASCNYSSQAASLFYRSEAKHTILENIRLIEKLYIKSLQENPHGFYCNKNPFCFECAMYCLDGYQNLALLYLNKGHLDYANNLAIHAIKIAPFSAHAYSVLATSIRVRIDHEIRIKRISPELAISQLQNAIEIYNQAIERSPEYAMVYKDGQLKCFELLDKLKD